MKKFWCVTVTYQAKVYADTQGEAIAFRDAIISDATPFDASVEAYLIPAPNDMAYVYGAPSPVEYALMVAAENESARTKAEFDAHPKLEIP